MDPENNFFSRLCSCDQEKGKKRSSSGQCKKGQRSFVGSLLFDRKSKDSDKRSSSNKGSNKDSSKDNQDCQVVPQIEEEVPCEPKSDPCLESNKKGSEKSRAKEPVPELPCFACYILEQNPLAPPCCWPKIEDDDDDEDGMPCPPPGCSQDVPTPTCGCELCMKSGYHGRCCDGRTYVRTTAEEPPQLEKA